jgi:hypothetical protein
MVEAIKNGNSKRNKTTPAAEALKTLQGGGDAASSSSAEPTALKATWTVDELERLVASAQQGDKKAMGELRTVMAKFPELRDEIGDLSLQTRRQMIQDAAGVKNVLLQEVLGERMQKLRRDLGRPDMTAIEDLLIDRCVTCWLDIHLQEELLISSRREGMNLMQAAWAEKRRDRAHHRFVSSVLALARARRLLAPQVNIAPAGTQQVNVARRGAQQLNMTQEGVWREDPAAGLVPGAVIVDETSLPERRW